MGTPLPPSRIIQGDLGLSLAITAASLDRPALTLTSYLPGTTIATGDYDFLTIKDGDEFAITFFGRLWNGSPDSWQLFVSNGGNPSRPLGGIFGSTPNGDGVSSSASIDVIWECLQGDTVSTIPLVAVAGVPGLIGSVSTSNEVSLTIIDDCGFPIGNDDGSYESGWLVQIPAGSSDFFSIPAPQTNQYSATAVAVMDFGSSFQSFPRQGLAPSNVALDPSGLTPDLSNPYVDLPLSFPPLTFVTTSGQLVNSSFSPITPSTDVVQYLQFPPGDPGVLGIGADTNSQFIQAVSGWSLDGYQTPANLFGIGYWGMRSL